MESCPQWPEIFFSPLGWKHSSGENGHAIKTTQSRGSRLSSSGALKLFDLENRVQRAISGTRWRFNHRVLGWWICIVCIVEEHLHPVGFRWRHSRQAVRFLVVVKPTSLHYRFISRYNGSSEYQVIRALSRIRDGTETILTETSGPKRPRW